MASILLTLQLLVLGAMSRVNPLARQASQITTMLPRSGAIELMSRNQREAIATAPGSSMSAGGWIESPVVEKDSAVIHDSRIFICSLRQKMASNLQAWHCYAKLRQLRRSMFRIRGNQSQQIHGKIVRGNWSARKGRRGQLRTFFLQWKRMILNRVWRKSVRRLLLNNWRNQQTITILLSFTLWNRLSVRRLLWSRFRRLSREISNREKSRFLVDVLVAWSRLTLRRLLRRQVAGNHRHRRITETFASWRSTTFEYCQAHKLDNPHANRYRVFSAADRFRTTARYEELKGKLRDLLVTLRCRRLPLRARYRFFRRRVQAKNS